MSKKPTKPVCRTSLGLPDGSGVIVDGHPDSIALVLADGRRHGDATVYLTSYGKSVLVNPQLEWELALFEDGR